MPLIKAFLLPSPLSNREGPGKEDSIENIMAEVVNEIVTIAPEIIIYISTPASAKPSEIEIFSEDQKPPDVQQKIVEFINKSYQNYQAFYVETSQADAKTHYSFGQDLAAEYQGDARKIVIIGSGDLAHNINEYSKLPPQPEGQMYDNTITTTLTYSDYRILLMTSDALRKNAGEIGFQSIVIIAGYLDSHKVISKILKYDNSTGVGRIVAEIEPGEYDGARNFLTRTSAIYEENRRRIEKGGHDHHHHH